VLARRPFHYGCAEIESEEAEAFAAAEVHDPTLLFIDFDLQSGQFLPEAFLNRLHQPVMPRVGIHQDHQIVSGGHAGTELAFC
jgi:hypothetical protein